MAANEELLTVTVCLQVICNKFLQTSAVTCMTWPSHATGPIVGLADGKVRATQIKSNKASTLYSTDSYSVALVSNVEGTGFLSGHADGSIVRWYVADDQKAKGQVGETPFAVGRTG